MLKTHKYAMYLVCATYRFFIFYFFIFLNERFYGAGNFYKDLFFGHLQPGVHKNLKGLAILFLEFDDVMVKALYSQWFVFIR